MIKKIVNLTDIGCFNSFHQNDNFKYGGEGQNCNIIFGLNGTGKTTISNIISFFSDASWLSVQNKTEIFNDIKRSGGATVELELQDNQRIKYPASSGHSKKIYIFNSYFISSHVFDGSKGKIKRFSSLGGEIRNPEIDLLLKKKNSLQEQYQSLKVENENLLSELDRITKEKSIEFQQTLTDKGKRLSNLHQKVNSVSVPEKDIHEYESELDELKKEYELSKKQEELFADIDFLKKLQLTPIMLDLENINNLLSTNIQKLSGEVLSQRIEFIQSLFEEVQHKQSVERWYKYGGEVLKKYSNSPTVFCPICNSDITDKISILLNDYSGFFDKAYEEFIKRIDDCLIRLNAKIELLNDYTAFSLKIEELRRKYSGITHLDQIPTLNSKKLRTELEVIKEKLEVKRNNIQYNEKIISPVEHGSFNDSVMEIKRLSDEMLRILESKSLRTHNIEDKIRDTYNSIIIIKFNELDVNGAIIKYQSNNNRLTRINDQDIPGVNEALRVELAKIKAESRGITKYLSRMGVDHFTIDLKDDSEENILIRFKGHDEEKGNLRNSLSEGEKTALAFAYFLSKCENELQSETLRRESTIVIDDPISSLDENRLYTTAYLIKSNFHNVKQLLVLSHNFLFLKYFNSFYRGRARCFYLEKSSLVDLPAELKNFETPYFYMLKSIQGFADETNNEFEYNNVKWYLPNYVRRVLETYLSFRFANPSMSRGSGFSPGLAEFPDFIKDSTLQLKEKEYLTDLISEINHTCNAHSHGNAHHTQEAFYISESDLRNLSKKALEIIDRMDGQKIEFN